MKVSRVNITERMNLTRDTWNYHGVFRMVVFNFYTNAMSTLVFGWAIETDILVPMPF